MTKISLDLDDALNKKLKQFALDKYGSTHGKQQSIVKDALIAYLDAHESKPAKEAAVCEATAEVANGEDTAIECAVEDGSVPPAARKVRKSKFGNDIEATNKVRELWANGERNVSKIAQQFSGYSLRQVSYWIDKELKEGREPTS